MRRAVVVGVLTLAIAVTGSGCKFDESFPTSLRGDNDGVSKKRSVVYKAPSNAPGMIVGESSNDGTITVRHTNGAVRRYHVSPWKNMTCSVGERWPSCTTPPKKPRPRYPETEG